MSDQQDFHEPEQPTPNVELVRARITRYEQTYGIYSVDLRRSIEARRIKKTPMVRRWLADYERLRAIEDL